MGVEERFVSRAFLNHFTTYLEAYLIISVCRFYSDTHYVTSFLITFQHAMKYYLMVCTRDSNFLF